MGEFFAATFPNQSIGHQTCIALDKRRRHGATIYAWALVHKDPQGRISVSDRREYAEAPAMIAALIGGLAGFAAGPFGAITGAVSGALVGLAADAIDRETHSKALDMISREVGRDGTVLIAEVAPADLGSFETLIRHCGGTVLQPVAVTTAKLPAA